MKNFYSRVLLVAKFFPVCLVYLATFKCTQLGRSGFSIDSMLDFLTLECPSPKVLFEYSIFSDVAGDITIVVDGEPFLLHKVNYHCLRLSN